MKETNRGPALSKAGDRKPSRRRRKAGRQAVSPEVVESLSSSRVWSRLAYCVRKLPGTGALASVLKRASCLLAPHEPVRPRRRGPELPSRPYRRHFPFPRDLRKKPVTFVSPSTPVEADRVRSPSPPVHFDPRPRGGVLSRRHIPELGGDPRVFNTSLEDPVVLRFRRACRDFGLKRRSWYMTEEEARVFGSCPLLKNVTRQGGCTDPRLVDSGVWCMIRPLSWEFAWPRAAVADFEISAALTTLHKREAPAPFLSPHYVESQRVRAAQAASDVMATTSTSAMPASVLKALEANFALAASFAPRPRDPAVN